MGLRVGSITFGGISSGLPTDDIIQKLLELEKRPITLLESRRDTFNTRLEIFQDLASKTRTLRDGLRELDNLGLLGNTESAEEEFSKFSATSSDSSVVTASASGLANPGSLELRVTALAKAERQISQGYASEDAAVGTGTFSIQVGSDDAVDVTIDASNNSVTGLVTAINNSGANVTASILNDGSANPYRIVIQANDTGASNAITIDDQLSGGTNPVLNVTQAAQDATVRLDPDSANFVEITSSTNTFSDVLTGLSFEVHELSEAGTTQRIDIDADVDEVVEGIQQVVSAFNAVTSVIQAQFEVDPSTNRGGPLIGDSTLTSLKQRLSSALAFSYGDGDVTTAGQIGLSVSTESVLTLDEDELRAKLAEDFQSVRSFFSGEGGLADALRSVADSFVDTVDGALVARINGTSRSIQDVTEQIEDATERLGTVEENLVRQFSALERIVSEVQIQGNFLAQFLNQQRR